MRPLRQNPIQRTIRTAHLSVLMTVVVVAVAVTVLVMMVMAMGRSDGDDGSDEDLAKCALSSFTLCSSSVFNESFSSGVQV